jgi:hypothetical protein
MIRILFILIVVVSIANSEDSFSQGYYGTTTRIGVGAQLFEPTGGNIQIFKGEYVANHKSYVTNGVFEIVIGSEKVFNILDDKVYKDGKWAKGGLRINALYLYPLITTEAPIVLQAYIGGGLESGTRKYLVNKTVESQFATGLNLMLRLELVTHGIDLGKSTWFFSLYIDLKTYMEFGNEFNYLAPVVGIHLRRGR